MKERLSTFINDERGRFGVKELAITVGAIVVIGAIVTWLAGGQLADWVTDVWDAVWTWIQDTFMT
ncbi:MAG: hypothetical protein FWG87_07010 [Defluviitaleaceae bacterium]|nr:hypothetical protein [Defluviitaleaceae bacterium]